jgi:multidrug efflux pump subunit AcrB
MRATTFRIRVGLLACLGVAALAGVAVAAFYVGVWLATPRGGPAAYAVGPTLRITAHYEGAPARVVEDTVTMPLEIALADLEGLESVESFSREGEAALTLYLRPGTDLDVAQVMAQNRVALALPGLPEAVHRQGIAVLKAAPLPALWLVVGSPDLGRDSPSLRRYAEAKLRPLVTTIPGVWDAVAGPGSGSRLRVRLDPDKLDARRLGLADILRALQEMPGAPDGDVAPDQLPELIVNRDANGSFVQLKDVGRVERADGEPGGVAYWNGDPVAFLAVEGAEPARLCEAVAEHLPTWRRRLPRGTELSLLHGPAVPGTEALLVEGRLPAAASPERVRDMAEQVATALQRLPDPRAERLVPAVLALPTDYPTTFRLYVALCPPAERAWTQAEVGERARQELKEFGEMLSRVTVPSILERPPRRRAPLVLRVSGPEVGESTRLVDEVLDRLNRSGVVVDAWPDYAGSAPRLTLDVDRDKAKGLGVSVADVMATLQVYWGPLDVQEVAPGIQVEMKPEGQDRLRDLNKLKVRNDKGAMVPLGALVAIREISGPAVLRRIDGQRCLLITAAPVPGVSAEEAGRRCRAIAVQARDDLGLPKAYKLE